MSEFFPEHRAVGAAAPAAQLRPESVVFRSHRHGRRLVLPVIVLCAVAAAAGFWAGALPEAWMNLAVAAGAVLIALLLGLGPIVGWLADRITVTTRRVIMHRGVLIRRRSEIPLSRIREVRSRRGIGQRMVGSGDIELFVGAEPPTRLHDLPAVERAVDALQELIEENYRAGLGGGAGGPGAGGVGGAGAGGETGQAPFGWFDTAQPPQRPAPPFDPTATRILPGP